MNSSSTKMILTSILNLKNVLDHTDASTVKFESSRLRDPWATVHSVTFPPVHLLLCLTWVFVDCWKYIQVLRDDDTLGYLQHTIHVMLLLISCHLLSTRLQPYAHALNTDDLSLFLTPLASQVTRGFLTRDFGQQKYQNLSTVEHASSAVFHPY